MAIMLITHAMGVVAEIAQRVVVMYAGKVVEEAPRRRAVRPPAPPLYPGAASARSRARLDGRAQEPASRRSRHRAEPARPAAGLPLRAALPLCDAGLHASATPPLREVAPGHKVACVPAERRRADERSPLLRVKRPGQELSRSGAGCCRARPSSVHAVDGVSFDDRRRRDARPRRRIRLRQVDHRAAASCA